MGAGVCGGGKTLDLLCYDGIDSASIITESVYVLGYNGLQLGGRNDIWRELTNLKFIVDIVEIISIMSTINFFKK